MSQFSIGEVAILTTGSGDISDVQFSVIKYLGEDVTVITGLTYIKEQDNNYYEIETQDGARLWARYDCLKKKPPKSNDKVTWDLVEKTTGGWNPSKVGVTNDA